MNSKINKNFNQKHLTLLMCLWLNRQNPTTMLQKLCTVQRDYICGCDGRLSANLWLYSSYQVLQHIPNASNKSATLPGFLHSTLRNLTKTQSPSALFYAVFAWFLSNCLCRAQPQSSGGVQWQLSITTLIGQSVLMGLPLRSSTHFCQKGC